MELRAPLAVPVEIRIATGPGPSPQGPRVFRLSRSVGEDGVRLARPAPFEIGRPVDVVLRLPEAPEPLRLRAELLAADGDRPEGPDAGGRELRFLDPPHAARAAIHRYVADRLGLI